ncbi:hypothetical protein PBY51_004507 [Eleginops maclovinus]|uniref:Uncharacterized protein n=1 Tax=Eleginops maclovinus TaxID=56733 RepID=A0AAN7Y065_ELEMC|nr:hypothetical protein PBY51_004507 [Eleginops maclovinus]
MAFDSRALSSSSGKQRLVNKPGWLRRDRWSEGRRHGREGKGGEGGSQLRALPARNNKQAFSYSNKYRASGEHGGAADKEEAWGERWRIPAALKPL